MGNKKIPFDELKRIIVEDTRTSTIIRTDIEPYDGWYWVEASGIIEKLFKENGGNPIPNTLARFFLNIDEDNQDFELVDGDSVHYTRTIKGEKRQKMIFGFKDEESMIAAKNAVADFAEFRIQINKMDKRIMESDDKISQSLKEAKTFLSRLFDLHYEWDCDEMLPEWHKRLLDSQSLIRKNIGKIPESKREMYLAAVKRGDACKEDMTILRFKRLSVPNNQAKEAEKKLYQHSSGT